MLFAGSLRLILANHSKPLNTIALSDADEATALAFVQQKLKEAKFELELTSTATASIGRLGGRASDLDNVCPPCIDTLRQEPQLRTPADLQSSQRFERRGCGGRDRRSRCRGTSEERLR